jgi:hypothetical protein
MEANDMSNDLKHPHPDVPFATVGDYTLTALAQLADFLGGLFCCGNNPPKEDTLNGSILNAASVIKHMVTSAAESEVGACFQNSQNAALLRVTLTELGHKQPVTPPRTDNYTAPGTLNETIKQKISKAMDMVYHWLTERFRQKQFGVYWRPGHENLGDCHTKHHPAQHHKCMHGLILHQAYSLQVLGGCVKLHPLPQLHSRAHIHIYKHTH